MLSTSHFLAMGCSALAWRAAIGRCGRPGRASSCWRGCAESANAVLPVAQVGGNVLGARVLALHGAGTVPAGAGMLVDFILEILTQILFFAIGLVVLIAIGGGDALGWAALGLGIAGLMGVGFVLAQRWACSGCSRTCWAGSPSGSTGRRWAGCPGQRNGAGDLPRPRRHGPGGRLHLMSWGFGAGEVWLPCMCGAISASPRPW